MPKIKQNSPDISFSLPKTEWNRFLTDSRRFKNNFFSEISRPL
jgi:hypothetical protein